jgi:hypothetical protein
MDNDVSLIDDDKLRQEAAKAKGLPATATWAEIDAADEKSLDEKDEKDLGLPADVTEDALNKARAAEIISEIEGKIPSATE